MNGLLRPSSFDVFNENSHSSGAILSLLSASVELFLIMKGKQARRSLVCLHYPVSGVFIIDGSAPRNAVLALFYKFAWQTGLCQSIVFLSFDVFGDFLFRNHVAISFESFLQLPISYFC